MLLSELDWRTPVGKANISRDWRLSLCILIGAVAAVMFWNAQFPDTFWFEKFWTGLATGSTIGAVLGFFWQVRVPDRRRQTSGWFLVCLVLSGSAFSSVALLGMAPDMWAQETELAKIRTLDQRGLSMVTVHQRRGKFSDAKSAVALSSFLDLTRRADLFYPSHETCTMDFELIMSFKDSAPLSYSGCVPERHVDDFKLKFQAQFSLRDIIVPGGRAWLDRHIGKAGS